MNVQKKVAKPQEKSEFIRKNANAIKNASRLVLAVSNPVRKKLLQQIMDSGETTVKKMVTVQKQEQSIVSQHLGILRNAGLVNVRKDGKWRHYSVEYPRIKRLLALVHKFEEI